MDSAARGCHTEAGNGLFQVEASTEEEPCTSVTPTIAARGSEDTRSARTTAPVGDKSTATEGGDTSSLKGTAASSSVSGTSSSESRSSSAAFVRLVEMTAAYDKRDPDPTKNYGIHGVDLKMVLKGPLGATQFVLYTGWLLPETIGARRDQWDGIFAYAESLAHHAGVRASHPMPANLGYHSPRPIYDGQTAISESCEYLDGAPCFYDGSGLNAARPFEALLREGDEGVWRVLEDYYRSTFEEAHDAS